MITVIVPIYNAETTIKKCIDSITKQSHKDIEIILIDDGSSDSSSAICEEHAKQDARIRHFARKNAGVSVTRNFGLAQAKGEYVTFVDADDYIDKFYIESLFSAMQDGYVVLSGFYRKTDKGALLYTKTLIETAIEKNSNAVPQTKAWDEVLQYGTICGKLFDIKTIRGNDINFNTSLQLHEDHLFYFKYLSCAQGIITIPTIGYNYVTDLKQSSLSTRKTHNTDMLLHSYDLCFAEIENIGVNFSIDLKKHAPKGVSYIYSFLLNAIKNTYMVKADDKTSLKVLKNLNKIELLKLYIPQSAVGYGFKTILLIFPRRILNIILKLL